jgi:hypothetical protein
VIVGCTTEQLVAAKEILREINENQHLYAMKEQHTPSWKDPTTSQNNFNPRKKGKTDSSTDTDDFLAGIHATLEKLCEEVTGLRGSLKFSCSKEKTRHSQPR